MFTYTTEEIPGNYQRVLKHKISKNGKQLTFQEVFDNWSDSHDFRTLFTEIIKNAHDEHNFPGVFFESPPVQIKDVDSNYEFVLVKTGAFVSAKAERGFRDFKDKIEDDSCRDGELEACSFGNLSGDAKLVIPRGRDGERKQHKYTDIMNFILRGDPKEVDDFWKATGNACKERISDRPMWISTCGTAVDWLHLRLDSRPKYYSYRPYKIMKTDY